MNDYQGDTTETLAALDAALAQAADLLGAWWYVTPSAAYNARQALDAWKRHQDATIVTNGQAYGVLLEVWNMEAGWWQTVPEEMEAD